MKDSFKEIERQVKDLLPGIPYLVTIFRRRSEQHPDHFEASAKILNPKQVKPHKTLYFAWAESSQKDFLAPSMSQDLINRQRKINKEE